VRLRAPQRIAAAAVWYNAAYSLGGVFGPLLGGMLVRVQPYHMCIVLRFNRRSSYASLPRSDAWRVTL
jgi:MFS family permease